MPRLLIGPGGIGDVIFSLPGLESSRAEYTELWDWRPVLPLIRFAGHTHAIAYTGLDLVGSERASGREDLEWSKLVAWLER